MLNVSVRPQPAAVAAVSVIAATAGETSSDDASQPARALRRAAPFGNIIDELSTWYCFTDKFAEDRARRKQRAEEQGFADPQPEPATNPFKKVGRNASIPVPPRPRAALALLQSLRCCFEAQ
jgi:hypothetical protein